MLIARLDELVPMILPNAERQGGRNADTWAVGSVFGEPGQSCRIFRRPKNTKQVFKDFAGPEQGDALELIKQVVCAGDGKAAYKWALQFCGVQQMNGRELARLKAETAKRQAAYEKKRAAEIAKNRSTSKGLWLQGQADLAGTLVERYLAGRDIHLSALSQRPRALRFHEGLTCTELGKGPDGKFVKVPAMVAAITFPDGGWCAIHRTYLYEHADGRVTKHPELEDARKSWPSFAGGMIPLCRGENGLPLKEAAAQGLAETCALTEGIEDALVGALVAPEWRWIAGVSLSNLANIELPLTLTELVLCKDNDWDNPDATKLFGRAQMAFHTRGHDRITVVEPEQVKDLNDLLQQEVKDSEHDQQGAAA